MNTKFVGIDLAKDVFQVCQLNQAGKVILNKPVSRKKLPLLIAQLESTVIAMESCVLWKR